MMTLTRCTIFCLYYLVYLIFLFSTVFYYLCIYLVIYLLRPFERLLYNTNRSAFALLCSTGPNITGPSSAITRI